MPSGQADGPATTVRVRDGGAGLDVGAAEVDRDGRGVVVFGELGALLLAGGVVGVREWVCVVGGAGVVGSVAVDARVGGAGAEFDVQAASPAAAVTARASEAAAGANRRRIPELGTASRYVVAAEVVRGGQLTRRSVPYGMAAIFVRGSLPSAENSADHAVTFVIE